MNLHRVLFLILLAPSLFAQISGTFNGDQVFSQRVSLGGNLTVNGKAQFLAGIETATGYGPGGITINGDAAIASVAGPESRRLRSIVVNGKLDLSCDAYATEDVHVTGALTIAPGTSKITARSITIDGDLILSTVGNVKIETTSGSLTIRGRIRGPGGIVGQGLLEVTINGGFFRFDGAKDANVTLSTTTNPISPKVVLNRLVNLSARIVVNDTPVIIGFVINGEGAKKLLVRAVGPTLTQFGVSGVMEDPKLSVTSMGRPTSVDINDWGDFRDKAALVAATTATGAFALPEGSKDAAALVDATPGLYTVMISKNSARGGEVIVEIYEVPEP